MKMTKNLTINGRSIRYDRGCYCLEDMFNACSSRTTKVRAWVEQQGMENRVVRKGFLIKTTWAALPDVISYANHLGVGDSVRRQFGLKTLAEQKAERERINVVETRRTREFSTHHDDPLLNAVMFSATLNDPTPTHHDSHSTNHRDTDVSHSHSHDYGSSHSHDSGSSHSSYDSGSYDSGSSSGGDSW